MNSIVIYLQTNVVFASGASYEDDARTDQWLQCKCLRRIHKDCVDYEDSSPDGGCALCVKYNNYVYFFPTLET